MSESVPETFHRRYLGGAAGFVPVVVVVDGDGVLADGAGRFVDSTGGVDIRGTFVELGVAAGVDAGGAVGAGTGAAERDGFLNESSKVLVRRVWYWLCMTDRTTARTKNIVAA